MSPPLGGSSGGCPAVWSISHHKGYSSRLSTVRPPHPCALSRGALRLAGDPLLDCVPGRLSPVASMAPGDVCHGPQCSLARLGPVALEYRSCHWPGGSAESPQHVRPMGCWFFPVPRLPYVCAVSWATWLLFTGVPAQCAALRLQCPGQLGSCSPMRPLGALFCLCGVRGYLAPVHRCARVVCRVACAVSWATWLLFTGAPAWCAVLRGVSWATWLLFTGVPAWFVALRMRCPGPLGSCSPVRPLGMCCVAWGVLGHLAPVHRCARVVCRVAYAVSWATWLLFTGAPARYVLCCVGCPGPLGSCSPLCPLGVLLRVCGVLGHLALVHQCAWPCCPVPLLSSVLVRVRCPGQGGACSPACALCAVCVCRWGLCLSSSPPNFFLPSRFFFEK